MRDRQKTQQFLCLSPERRTSVEGVCGECRRRKVCDSCSWLHLFVLNKNGKNKKKKRKKPLTLEIISRFDCCHACTDLHRRPPFYIFFCWAGGGGGW